MISRKRGKSTLAFCLLLALYVLLLLNPPVQGQIRMIQCRFGTDPAVAGARIEASLVGANWMRINPGSYVRLIEGRWLFKVTAPGYSAIRRPVNVTSRSSQFAYTFRLTPQVTRCSVCGKSCKGQSQLNRHLLDAHTWVKIDSIAPGDAKLTLDDRKQIEAGQQIKVGPGRHTIKGDSHRGYLESPMTVDVVLGKPETISKITVPDVAGKLIVGKVDPSDAEITVDGKAVKPGGVVEIRPSAGKATASVIVSATAPGCVPWSKQYELGWKQRPQVVPDIRMAYGTLKVLVEPVESANGIKIELIDEHSQSIALPQNGRVAPGKYKLKATNTPKDYKQLQADQTYEIKDHAAAELAKVVIAKAPGSLALEFVNPKTGVQVSTLDKKWHQEQPGTYQLDAGKYDLVATADGFVPWSPTTVTISPNKTESVRVDMTPIAKPEPQPSQAAAEIASARTSTQPEPVTVTFMIRTSKNGRAGKAAANAEIKISPDDHRDTTDPSGIRGFTLTPGKNYLCDVTWSDKTDTYRYGLLPSALPKVQKGMDTIQWVLKPERELVCAAADGPCHSKEVNKALRDIALDIIEKRKWSLTEMVSKTVSGSEVHLGNENRTWGDVKIAFERARTAP